jgi:3-mercaptopyruvate sulfurtransferase SseA
LKKNTSIFIALAAVLITVAFVWYKERPAATKNTGWEDVLAEAKAGGYRIVTTEELADRYRQDPAAITLIDTRQEWEYRSGHLEGAVNFPMEPTAWARWRKAGELAKFLGTNKDRHLVFY